MTLHRTPTRPFYTCRAIARRKVCAGLGLLAFSPVAFAGQTIEISVLDNGVLASVALAVLERAYAKLDLTLHTQTFPLRRGVQMADAGELDGDLMRAEVSLKDWSRLVVLKVPVARVVFSAYRRGDCPAQVSIDDLSSKRIAYMRGARSIETLIPESALVGAKNNWDALRHVQRGIADFAVVDQTEAEVLLIKAGATGICRVSEPVLAADLFHSLNVRHAALAAKVEAVLQDMESQGQIKRIWARETVRAQALAVARAP